MPKVVSRGSPEAVLEPRVFRFSLPLSGAVHPYQRDLPPALPACLGSPASLVAAALEPPALTPLFVRVRAGALAKASPPTASS